MVGIGNYLNAMLQMERLLEMSLFWAYMIFVVI